MAKTPPVPTLADFTDPREILIVFHDDGPDPSGQRFFLAFWISDTVGPRRNEHGVHGQAFVTCPDRIGKRDGRPVRVFDPTADRS